jgi:hypothetical protein
VQYSSGEPGPLSTVTSNVSPSGTLVAKVKEPSAVIERSSPPLFWSTIPVPSTPRTVPPTVWTGAQTPSLLQPPDVQSEPLPHICPSPHWPHTVPPQSTSDSS